MNSRLKEDNSAIRVTQVGVVEVFPRRLPRSRPSSVVAFLDLTFKKFVISSRGFQKSDDRRFHPVPCRRRIIRGFGRVHRRAKLGELHDEPRVARLQRLNSFVETHQERFRFSGTTSAAVALAAVLRATPERRSTSIATASRASRRAGRPSKPE